MLRYDPQPVQPSRNGDIAILAVGPTFPNSRSRVLHRDPFRLGNGRPDRCSGGHSRNPRSRPPSHSSHGAGTAMELKNAGRLKIREMCSDGEAIPTLAGLAADMSDFATFRSQPGDGFLLATIRQSRVAYAHGIRFARHGCMRRIVLFPMQGARDAVVKHGLTIERRARLSASRPDDRPRQRRQQQHEADAEQHDVLEQELAGQVPCHRVGRQAPFHHPRVS
ncbi:hypothetical protein ACVWY2_004162 [Bradyrhizobium sp. JR6.1]